MKHIHINLITTQTFQNMTSTTVPPTFAEPSKFNGSNWIAWKGLVNIAVNLHGAYGYLDGTTPRPSPTPQNTPLPASPTAAATPAPTAPSITPWESTTPTMAEWRVRDAWTMGLLIYNTTDPVGLGVNINGTAADAWKSYQETYKVVSEIAIINADRDLRNTVYNDGNDFQDFINRMCTKWSNATTLGAPIVLSALLQSWGPIVATLYTTQTSCDAINQLMTHWARISRERITNARTSTSALQAFTNKQARNRF
jgi:hypothetical protein